jgi:hypothetical protein
LQRTTLYRNAPAEPRARSFAAPELQPIVQTPLRRRATANAVAMH